MNTDIRDWETNLNEWIDFYKQNEPVCCEAFGEAKQAGLSEVETLKHVLISVLKKSTKKRHEGNETAEQKA